MIQKKKGKIEYFTMQKTPNSAGNKTLTPVKKPAAAPGVTVLIPKLTSGPGEKLVKKEIKKSEMTKNGPNSNENSKLVSYSDSSSEEKIEENVAEPEMEVDEDGAPLQLPLPVPSGKSAGNLKRPIDAGSDEKTENSEKKAKISHEEVSTSVNEDVSSSNDA